MSPVDPSRKDQNENSWCQQVSKYGVLSRHISAVRYLKRSAGELGIDSNRIAAFGSSAGGHLASFLGVADAYPTANGNEGVSAQVSYVVHVHGLADMTCVADSERLVQFIGATFEDAPET